MKKALALGAAFMLLGSVGYSQTFIYLNFDEATTGTFADGASYTPGSTEILDATTPGLDNLSVVYRNNAGDGPSIGTPAGASGTSQGGNALLTDSGSGQDEGIMIVSDNGLAPQDFTLEVLWYTDDITGGTNTVGLQSPVSSEWPFGEVKQVMLRVYEDNNVYQFWNDKGDSQSMGIEVALGSSLTWYHDVYVFDYDEANSPTSSVEVFRNGASQGSVTYDASDISVVLFNSTAQTLDRRLAIGIHNNVDAAPGDHRGLDGAVDAVAVTLGALNSSQFVLPSGTPVTAPANVKSWELY